MAITAKVIVSNVVDSGPDQKHISLYADYADGRNKEWATSTPSLSLVMTVKNDVAEYFKLNQRLTLTFESVPEID